MGVGQAVLWSTAGTGALVLVGFWVVTSIRDRIRNRRAMAAVVDEQIAAAEQTYRTELHAAPVIGVPYDAVRSDGSHDLYPHMSDHARDAVVASLNEWLTWTARERTS